MSQFSDAAKQMLEAELVCPKCHAVNIPGKPPSVRVDDGDMAGCRECGQYGHRSIFVRPPLKEK